MEFDKSKLRKETFINNSGKLLNKAKVKSLKESHYIIKHNHTLDGDAPKSFIKAYFFKQDSKIRKSNTKSWQSFIAKTAEKWYPHESVIEYMINCIGIVLGLNMNDVKLVCINDQIRFLSKYFRGNDENLIHGAEICGQYLEDQGFAKQIALDKTTARDLFTFEFIEEAFQAVYPDSHSELLEELVKLLVFDAITGNNDRHFYNWGILDTPFKKQKKPKFAPIYDSARGLLWNWSDKEIIKQLNLLNTGGKKLHRYIENAAPRISYESNKNANHFELVEYLKAKNNRYNDIICSLSSNESESKILHLVYNEFFLYFIPERQEAIKFILSNRFRKIREG